MAVNVRYCFALSANRILNRRAFVLGGVQAIAMVPPRAIHHMKMPSITRNAKLNMTL
ncbi:hypothetical protein BD410DRAFT_782899 [Rickenella mellea]|uniref:Uncharacterized protein n=1 Tax=Rickenella mellea TaxID=50990 RepID=A0A4Y7QGL7_9AGAM|nr:hypothetical protein BD410DRAFT_782899 [Rickenella mellea]